MSIYTRGQSATWQVAIAAQIFIHMCVCMYMYIYIYIYIYVHRVSGLEVYKNKCLYFST
jgi:hypothetical protein